MPTTEADLRAVLDAAQRLLAARHDGMLTDEEWTALREDVTACERPPTQDRAKGAGGEGRTA